MTESGAAEYAEQSACGNERQEQLRIPEGSYDEQSERSVRIERPAPPAKKRDQRHREIHGDRERDQPASGEEPGREHDERAPGEREIRENTKRDAHTLES